MGITDTILSGTGFSGLEAAESPIGNSTDYAFDHGAVARWTKIPGDCISTKDGQGNSDPHLYVGVMAYHANNIKEVEFKLNGGDGVIVTEQEINPQTNLPEYFVKIDKNDILDKMNVDRNNPDYSTERNLELRAIIRPNAGQVKILQHDLAGVSGSEGGQLICDLYGVSGGITASSFYDKRLHPGEHSYFANVKREEDIPTVYVSPAGKTYDKGNWDGRTESQPLNHVIDGIRAVKDLILEKVNNGDLPADRKYTRASDSSNFVDVSDGRIVFLPGTYDKEHYNKAYHGPDGSGVSRPGVIGDGDLADFSDARSFTGKSFFTYTGDLRVPRDEIVFESADPSIDQKENTFNPAGTISANMGMQKVQHHKVVRQFKPEEGQEVEFGKNSYFEYLAAGYQTGLERPGPLNAFWMDDILTVEKLILHTKLNDDITIPAIITNSTMIGSSRPAGVNIQINNTFSKSANDQIICTYSLGNDFIGSWPSYMFAREVRFPEGSEYEKFNGFYTNAPSLDWIAEESVAFGTTGIAWPTYSGSRSGNAGNTIWRRINTRRTTAGNTFEQQFTPQFYRLDDDFEVIEPLSASGLQDSYKEIADSYGASARGYFQAPYYLGLPKPLLTLNDRQTNKNITTGIIDQTDPITGDPILLHVNDEGYYDNVFMTQVMHENDGTAAGFTATGIVLADMDKPLVWGDDSSPATQKFLFRQGSTASKGPGGVRRPVQEANFTYEGLNQGTEGYFAWCEGFTTTANPNQGHRSFNSTGGAISVFGNPIEDTSGVTNDAYPVWCVGNNGNDDSFFHLDMMQNWMHGPIGSSSNLYNGISRLENNLIAYNKFINVPGQLANFGNNHYSLKAQLHDSRRLGITLDTGSGNFTPGEIVYQGVSVAVDGSYVTGESDIFSSGGVTWTAAAKVISWDNTTGLLDLRYIRGRQEGDVSSTALREDLQSDFTIKYNAFKAGTTVYGASSGASRILETLHQGGQNTDAQTGFIKYNRTDFLESWRDFAWVSNSFGTPAKSGGASTVIGGFPIRHFLVYNNLFEGQAVNFKIGDDVYGTEAREAQNAVEFDDHASITGGIGYFKSSLMNGNTAGGYSADRYREIYGVGIHDKVYKGILQAEYMESVYGSTVAASGITIDRGTEAVTFRGNYFSNPGGSLIEYVRRAKGVQSDPDNLGLTAAVESFDFIDNYYWPYTPKSENESEAAMTRLVGRPGPRFENLDADYGGANFDPAKNESFNILAGSNFSGGAGTTVQKGVPFDINRQKKPVGRSSIGPDEPSNPEEFVELDSSFSTTGTSITLASLLARENIDPADLYGKAIKIRAIKNSTGEVLFSTNFIRIQNESSLEEPIKLDISASNEYEFNRDGADVRYLYDAFTVFSEVINEGTEEEEEVTFIQMNSEDWLAVEYGVHTINIASNTGGAAGNGHIRFKFSPIYEGGDPNSAVPRTETGPSDENENGRTEYQERSFNNRELFTNAFTTGNTLGLTFDGGFTLELSADGRTLGSQGDTFFAELRAYHCNGGYTWPNNLVSDLFLGNNTDSTVLINKPDWA